MKALIIGAGGVGSAIANIASRRSFLTQVIIADHDKQRAENAVARLNGDPRFTAAQVDASQVQAVDRKSTRLNSSHVSESRMPSSA